MSSLESLQSIAEEISLGFEALLEQLDAQKRLETDLREQLVRVVEKVSALTFVTNVSFFMMLQPI